MYRSHLISLNLQVAAALVFNSFQDVLHSCLLWSKWIFISPSEFMCKAHVVVLQVEPVAESCQSKGHSICCFLFPFMPWKAGSGFSLNKKFCDLFLECSLFHTGIVQSQIWSLTAYNMRYSKLLILLVGDKLKGSHITSVGCLISLMRKAKQSYV